MENKLEQIVLKSFQNGFQKHPQTGLEIRQSDSMHLCDFEIYKNERFIGAVVVKSKSRLPILFSSAVMMLGRCKSKFNLRFLILTDGEKYYIEDAWTGEYKISIKNPYSLEEVIQCIATPYQLFFDADDHIKPLQKIMAKYGLHPGLRNGSLVFDNQNNLVYLSPKVEENLFESIVQPIHTGTLRRFCSMDTLFAMIDNESFRMMSLDGMNDKEDGDYLWKCLYSSSMDKEYYLADSETSYIMSCSNVEENNLCMWRLYGQDTAGICLDLEIKEISESEGFILAPVDYNDVDSKLGCLKEIVDYFSLFGTTFILRDWNVWRAFFKSINYKVEEEVRLLYLPSRDKHTYSDENSKKEQYRHSWVLTADCKVFSECVDFQKERAEKFPLKIKTIYLGSNCPEQKTNKKQIQNILQQKSTLLSNPPSGKEVEESSIRYYRTSKK